MQQRNSIPYKEKPASSLRKVIAHRMTESKSTVPHFYLTMDVSMDEMVHFRSILNEQSSAKISYNDILMKASAVALTEHPECNVSYINDTIRYYKTVNISLAVAVEGGLLTPTIRECEKKSIQEINAEATVLIEKARAKRIRASDQMGGTFSITNLGMFGIEEFAPIINPPQALILAVGAIREIPVVKGDSIVIGKRMKLTLSCDHRAVDGAMGAKFLADLVNILENPSQWLS